jgi:hypothetical protein
VGAVGDSSAPGRAPSLAIGTKREAVLIGSTPSAKRPYRAFGNLGLSNFLVFCFFLLAARFHSEYFSFLHTSSSSSEEASAACHRPLRGSLKTCWRSQRKSRRWRQS